MDRKLALITGASRGIGEAAAERFAAEGYDLVLSCRRSAERLEALGKRLGAEFGTKCCLFVGDMGCFGDVEELLKKVRMQFGERGIDVLVNNAGVSYIGLFTEMSAADWDRVISSNLTSVFNVCRLFVPDMVAKQAGRIVNVSSVWGNVGASCEVAYSASKGAVNAFTKALAKELAPSHICVNTVAFGMIDTEMNGFLSEEEKDMLMEEIPACRMGSRTEAADMIFEAANAPEYLTGQVITMDGGWV
jgi:3-oxoacyl-[acyl-carrier protein] reductase